MSDIESDYYSDSDSSETSSDNEVTKNVVKKNLALRPSEKNMFGSGYEEDDDADNDDDIEDDVEEQDGGDDDETEEGEVKENDQDEDDDAKLDDEEEEEEEDDDDDIEIDEEGQAVEKQIPKTVKPKKTTQLIIADDEDDEDEYEENYLQKFDNDLNKNYISDFHPECLNHNSDEVAKLCKVVRDENNIIIDTLHKTIPYLTKYEKARVLGQRAKQIESGAKPFVKVPENIIDGYIIAELELKEKKIPFIIKRPIPGGAFEYWNIKDLEIINF